MADSSNDLPSVAYSSAEPVVLIGSNCCRIHHIHPIWGDSLRWDGFPQNRVHSPEQTTHPKQSSELHPFTSHHLWLFWTTDAPERRRLIVSSSSTTKYELSAAWTPDQRSWTRSGPSSVSDVRGRSVGNWEHSISVPVSFTNSLRDTVRT